MAMIGWAIEDDYPLKGSITNFEAYMFITTPKYIAQHIAPIPGELIFVDGNRSNRIVRMADLNDRKAWLTKFNHAAKAQIPSIPKPSGLSCCMIDFMPMDKNGPDGSDFDYHVSYIGLRSAFMDYMRDNDRIAVLVQHWAQKQRYQHVHILYQRKRGQHSEFQTWLRAQPWLSSPEH